MRANRTFLLPAVDVAIASTHPYDMYWSLLLLLLLLMYHPITPPHQFNLLVLRTAYGTQQIAHETQHTAYGLRRS